MNKLILASGNAGKLKEFQDLLAEVGFSVHAQSDYQVGSVEETGSTFVENAIIKARHACAETGLPAIADDSGIEVDALNGAPGVYSARYGGAHASDQDNNTKLLAELAQVPPDQRSARYHCVLVFMRHALDPTPIISQGIWEGRILDEAVGSHGFGYDPLFWVPSHRCSSAQLSKEEKNRISHRGIALQELLSQLRARYPSSQ